MNTIQLIILSTLIAVAGFFANCNFHPEKAENARLHVIESEREAGITRSIIQGEIQDFRIEMAGKIMENNRSVAEIKRRLHRGDRWSVADLIRKIKNGDESLRVTQETRISALQSENREMKRIINNYSDLRRQNWDTFKKDYSKDMESLSNSLTSFFEYSDVTNTHN